MAARTSARRPEFDVRFTAVDREAARQTLWQMKSPGEVAIDARGAEAHLFATLHMVEVLVVVAWPLSPELKQALSPWFAEAKQRRERLLDENRRLHSRRKASDTRVGTR
jgi:hypothetical protein